MTGKTESARMDRYEGAMLGVAVGDALGAPLEFTGADAIRRKYGGPVREMVGGGWLSVEPGEVTDDTQMTLAVAEGFAEKEDGNELLRTASNFLRWYATKPKDVGGTCAAVLEEMQYEWESEIDWYDAAHRLFVATGGQTAGNGALMRTIYPILWGFDESEAAGLSVDVAKLTHSHPVVRDTTSRYARAIWRIIHEDAGAVPQRVKRHLDLLPNVPDPKPSGYCLDSLACAADSVRRTNSFEDALVDAVNRGGDADTIGAITGGLAGAIYGASAIPARWIDALDNEPNRRTVRIFHDAAETGNALATRLIDLAHTAYGRG